MLRSLTTLVPCLVLGLALTPTLGAQSFVNWETAPVTPLDLTPDGTRLLATNLADDRLEVFDLVGGIPTPSLSIPVGIDQHLRKTIHCIKKMMIKIEFKIKGLNFTQFLPDGLADDLGGLLIIPTARAPEVPFGMVSLKFFHIRFL